MHRRTQRGGWRRLLAAGACSTCALGAAWPSAALAAPLPGLDGLTPVRAFREIDKKTFPELPESIVTDLLQDEQGVLWVATLGGLATYDGHSLRAVRDAQAPAGGSSALARRAGGGLYASSRRGVHAFDGRRWRRLATDGPVFSMAEVEENGRWIWVVFNAKLWKTPVNDAAPSWRPVALPDGVGAAVAVLSDLGGGAFVLASRRYLHCRDGTCAPIAPAAGPPERLSAALATRAGALWIGTWDGRLQVAEPGVSGWASVDLGSWPSGGIRSLAEDRRGRVWAGGMARLCHGGRSEAWSCWGTEAGLPSSAVLALLADREGTLWLGLNGAGVLHWVGEAWSHLRQWPGASPPPGFDVTGVASTSDGGLLVSVFGKGMLRWDGRGLTAWGRADGLEEDIRAVVEPSPGVIWTAGRHGVFERAGDRPFRRTLSLDSGFVGGFARGPDGQWYAWTEEHGIFRRAEGWQPDGDLDALLPDGFVGTMAWTRDGALWIGASTSLVVRRRDGTVERRALGLDHGLPESVRAILEVAPDEVWVAGIGGVASLRGGQARWLSGVEGALGNVYFLERSAEGTIWAGGSRGIGRYREGRFTVYDTSNGLVSDECNQGAVAFPDGSLIAGTAGSLARFDAGFPPVPAGPLRVYWREPPAQGRDGVVRLSPERRRVLLAWSAPWLGPQAVEYRTRVGRDAGWSPATRNPQLAVESLPAGTSEVAVQARLVDADDSSWTAPALLRIEVAPYLWETTWAKAVALALAAALLLLASRRHALRLHERRERALVRMRSDFMASASHELRTPIAQIRLFADTLRLDRVRDDRERAEALDTIHRATQRLEALAGNLLQLARGQAGAPAAAPRWTSVADLLHGAARDLVALSSWKDVTLRVEVEPALHAHLDVEAMRQVLANLGDNAVKYGPPAQTVRMGAEPGPEGLRLWVEDQGPGIPRADRERVWQRFERLERDRNSAVTGTGIGLAVVRETLARAGGRAWIEDVEPAGTRVVILLPQPVTDVAVPPGAPVGDSVP